MFTATPPGELPSKQLRTTADELLVLYKKPHRNQLIHFRDKWLHSFFAVQRPLASSDRNIYLRTIADELRTLCEKPHRNLSSRFRYKW